MWFLQKTQNVNQHATYKHVNQQKTVFVKISDYLGMILSHFEKKNISIFNENNKYVYERVEALIYILIFYYYEVFNIHKLIIMMTVIIW